MADGSRLFLELPQSVYPDAAVEHLKMLPRAELVDFLDTIPESWIDFRFEGHEFSINDQLGEFWFFVKDPVCPDSILTRIRDHFVRLVG
ncbi:hypothetical protein IHQ71_24140 [Rhizobium sp. TH2]|uniref:hypothetical protein n=1 Tax=Rhizobium sp. TH2 TaxID=2775403 RepID=UPI0021588C6C|nr:hypothetical protein [Rhizobium sp. TH2]UVC08211.1 hypothetical protein IHQ71_24140 [Rhizobium sp. TH2]